MKNLFRNSILGAAVLTLASTAAFAHQTRPNVLSPKAAFAFPKTPNPLPPAFATPMGSDPYSLTRA